MSESAFLFVTCQAGVEALCKERMLAQFPDIRFAFSRPGFLTFKLPAGAEDASYDVQNAFVRAWGRCDGRFEAADVAAGAAEFWKRVEARSGHIHVWQRDAKPVSEGFEPFSSEIANAAAAAIQRAAPEGSEVQINESAPIDASVVDCILVEPDQWWVGSHTVTAVERGWVGGVPPLTIPEDMISRAYLKMHEALAWSRMPFRRGDVCVEIGCAPGGAVQAMLEHGLNVIGVDPAEMSPLVANAEGFQHIRKRGRDVRRKEFAPARWLMSDSNVSPAQTLDMVEDIVTHERVNIRGMLLTLKMAEWKLLKELPQYLDRIRGWGFRYVRPRHLAFNRHELCIAAFRSKSVRRFG